MDFGDLAKIMLRFIFKYVILISLYYSYIVIFLFIGLFRT
jgi:hypothetical protein